MIHFLVMHWQWFAFSCSALYTIAGIVWTIRAERLLRRLKREQAVLGWSYNDLRQDVDDVQSFLEGGNTVRQIKVVPITCGAKGCPR